MLRNDFTFYIVIIQLTEQQRQQLQSMDPQQRSIFIQKLQRDREAQLRAQQQQKLMAQRQQMMAQQQSQQQQQQPRTANNNQQQPTTTTTTTTTNAGTVRDTTR